jgi:hypothetical protein
MEFNKDDLKKNKEKLEDQRLNKEVSLEKTKTRTIKSLKTLDDLLKERR